MPTDPPDRETRALAALVGAVNIACAVMIVVALVRFSQTILPKYGARFSYMLVILGGAACWFAFRGIRILLGRGGERERRR
jgi:hypothetical protein